MSNIVNFPRLNKEDCWYPSWLSEALNSAPSELATNIRAALDAPIRKYEKELFDSIELSLPLETTETQKTAIHELILRQRESIRDLVQSTALANAKSVLDSYEPSK